MAAGVAVRYAEELFSIFEVVPKGQTTSLVGDASEMDKTGWRDAKPSHKNAFSVRRSST